MGSLPLFKPENAADLKYSVFPIRRRNIFHGNTASPRLCSHHVKLFSIWKTSSAATSTVLKIYFITTLHLAPDQSIALPFPFSILASPRNLSRIILGTTYNNHHNFHFSWYCMPSSTRKLSRNAMMHLHFVHLNAAQQQACLKVQQCQQGCPPTAEYCSQYTFQSAQITPYCE